MDWNRSTVIVGYDQEYNVTKITHDFREIPGFVRIKYTYRLTKAMLVEVKPFQINIFMERARSVEHVEYVDFNYLLSLASFDEYVGSWFDANGWSCRSIRLMHGLTNSFESGRGIIIAVIDTGVWPHPYLPVSSFDEALDFIEFWPRNIQNNNTAKMEIETIAKLENPSTLSPLSANASKTIQNDFLHRTTMHLSAFSNALWTEWAIDADRWYSGNNIQSGIRQVNQTVPIPKVPLYQGVVGTLRRISPFSYNFVDNNLNVEDTVGHGTEIAGILSGRAGISYNIADKSIRSRLQKYEVDVLGIVPDAELMVLKCYDGKKHGTVQQGTVDAMIRALEHAYQHNVDIIYIGLTVDSNRIGFTKPLIALSNTIQAVVTKGIPVVCPAGNSSKAELHFPAAIDGTIAVTSVNTDINNNFVLADYSNYAGPREKVAFTAFGGNKEQGVLTTSGNFGFTQSAGTSVAAAITTGIIARYLSEKHIIEVERIYKDEMNNILQSSNKPSLHSPLFPIVPKRIDIDDLLRAARASTYLAVLGGSSPPSPEFGWGLIRQFLP